MKTVIFVDDDMNVLSALRRMLRGLRPAWDVHFCAGAAEALAVAANIPFDVIVTDLRMAGMDGNELLRRIAAFRPGAVRMMLSGQATEDSILRAAGVCHQFLSKPCAPADLAVAIDRALALRHRIRRPDVRRLVGGLEALPSPVETHSELLGELDKPDCSAKSVAAIIERDVAMTAELLRLTNSQYFALSRKVSTVLQATQIIGLETVRVLVLRIGIFRTFSGEAALRPMLQKIGERGITLAAAVRAEAAARRLPQHQIDNACCVAMLNEIGMLAVLESLPRELAHAAAAEGHGDGTIDMWMMEACGASCCEVGAYLLGLWGFNDGIVEAVAHLNDAQPLAQGNPLHSLVASVRSTLALEHSA